jgi:hypothetical protein
MSNTEQGIANDELGSQAKFFLPWTFAIPCSVFDIPSLSPDVLAAKRENPLLRPRVGGFAGPPRPLWAG